MVKYYVQNLNGDLKIAFAGDLDGLKDKVNKELQGDIDTAVGNLQKDIEDTRAKIKEMEEKLADLGLPEGERIATECGIAQGRLAIYNNEEQIKKIQATNIKDLVFFELTPVEL